MLESSTNYNKNYLSAQREEVNVTATLDKTKISMAVISCKNIHFNRSQTEKHIGFPTSISAMVYFLFH